MRAGLKKDKKYRERRQALANKLSGNRRKKKIDFIAVTSFPNLKYFFNYGGHSYERFCCGLINANGENSVLIVPKLDLGKTRESQTEDVFAWDDNEGYEGAFLKAGARIRVENSNPVVGCESSFSLSQMGQFKSVMRAKSYESIGDAISELRLVKSTDELSSIRDSAKRLSKSYRVIEELIRPGVTESQVAFEIMMTLEEKGLESTEPPLVQSGKNSAVPHSTPSKKKIERGDTVVVDASAPNSEGYFSDYTRTYVIGRASPRQKEVYEIVRRAQEEGIRVSKAGNAAGNVDIAARTVINKEGYGEYFVHRTGHGLGLEVHEAPYLKSGNTLRLSKGMVFTVEPGIYLPGKFGVRIEDDIALSDRPEDITRLSRELMEI